MTRRMSILPMTVVTVCIGAGVCSVSTGMIACNDLRGLEWGVVGVVWWVWWIDMLHYATAYANTTPILRQHYAIHVEFQCFF